MKSEDKKQDAIRRSAWYYVVSGEIPYACDHKEGRVCALHTDAKRCMETILNVVKAFTGTQVDILARVKYESNAVEIFERAVQLQTKVKSAFEECDYDIFTSDVGAGCKPFWGYEAIQGLSEMAPRVIWLCVSLGMKAYPYSYNPPATVCVKALVICDNWDPMC
jgi:hypothetical protein